MDKSISYIGGGASLLGLLTLFQGFPLLLGMMLSLAGAVTTLLQLFRSKSKTEPIRELEKFQQELREFCSKIDKAMLLTD